MLDLKLIREKSDFIESAISRRNGEFSIKPLLACDEKFRQVQNEWEELNRRTNEISQSFKSSASPGDQTALKEETKTIKAKRQEIELLRQELEEQLRKLELSLPNIPDAAVPDGKDEKANVEIKRWGKIPDLANPLPHYEIGTQLKIFDFERGVKIAQSRFTVLLDRGAKIERALMNFMLDFHSGKGYSEIFPPILVNRDCLVGVGQLPKFEGDFYKCADDDLYLIPTAEVPVTNLYRDEVLSEEQLPILHCAYTPNFRREAGAAGKDTRGYIRQHQFNKVELVHFTTPEMASEQHEKLTLEAEALLEALELPYRRIMLCAGDLGFSAQKCYDLEVWFPAQNQYREISSCSVFGDFQARRANLKYKPADGGKARYLCTMNGSALAIGRTLAAILEIYQQADGSVLIPTKLQPYLNGMKVIN